MPFCSLEGLDGSGKSTVMSAITEEYPDAVTTREPTNLKYGRLVRDRLSKESGNELIDFLLFMCDRMQHIEQRVKPGVAEGKVVVSDRYADSTRAYQPVALTGSGELFESAWEAKYYIEQVMRPWNYEPDVTLYIDISVDTAIERALGDEKYENREFLSEVRDNYEALCESKDRMVRIDGEQSREKVAAEAVEKLNFNEDY